MSDRAWMPLYIADYLADTGHLTAAEHGAYLLLIMRYWQDGVLPADERLIARYSRLSPSEWAESRDVIAALFDDGWKHGRIDAELAKASEIVAKRRSAAIARHGGNKRGADAVQVESTCSDMRVPPTPTPQKEEPNGSSKKRGTRIPDDFEPDIEWAMAQGLSRTEAAHESAQFLDYWRGKPGKDGVKLDWPGTWRMWVRNAIKRSRTSQRANAPPGKRPNAVEALFANRAERSHEPEIRGSDSRDAELLPPNKPGLSAAAPHVLSAVGRRYGSGHH